MRNRTVVLLAGLVFSSVAIATDGLAAQRAPIQGLFDRNTQGRSELPVSCPGLSNRATFPSQELDKLRGVVIEAYWDELQPCGDDEITADNRIDQALAFVATRPNLRLKVRIFAGRFAPTWVKTRSCPSGEQLCLPVQMVAVEGSDTFNFTVPRWWTSAYQSFYKSFITKLKSKYNASAKILEWTVSGATTFFAEPMQRHIWDSPDNCRNLLAAGYTKQKDIDSQKVFITSHQAFTSRSSVVFTPLQYCIGDADGNVTGKGVDVQATLALMTYLRSVTAEGGLAGKGVLSTTNLQDPLPVGQGYPQMYAEFANMGGPITFQTAAPSRVGSLRGAIELGIGHGANAIELPRRTASGYCATSGGQCSEDPLSPTEMTAYNNQLIANPYLP